MYKTVIAFAIFHVVLGLFLLGSGLYKPDTMSWSDVHKYLVFGLIFAGGAQILYNQARILKKLKLAD